MKTWANNLYINSDVYRAKHNREHAVYVLDEDAGFGDALCMVLKLEGFDARLFDNRHDIEARVAQRAPQVVIMPTLLDGEPTLPLMQSLQERAMGASVFLTSNQASIRDVVQAMREGAVDFFVKPIDVEALLKSIRETLRQNVHILPPVNGVREVRVKGFSQLTQRQREVLQHMIRGRTSKEIAIEMGISPRTVEAHRLQIKHKLSATSIPDLMRIALTS